MILFIPLHNKAKFIYSCSYSSVFCRLAGTGLEKGYTYDLISIFWAQIQNYPSTLKNLNSP